MLIQAGLPSKLWPEALSAACYITNRLPTKVCKEKHRMKLDKKESLISPNYVYTTVIHMLSTTKPKLKAKWQPVHGPVPLLAMKPRINRGFGMEPQSLLEEILSSMSLSSVIKTGTSSEPVGENTTTNIVTLAGILQPVRESHRVDSIRHNDPVKPRHFNILELENNYGPVLDDDRSDLHHEHSAQSTPPAASDHKSRHVVDDTLDLVNQLLRENQETAEAEQPNPAPF